MPTTYGFVFSVMWERKGVSGQCVDWSEQHAYPLPDQHDHLNTSQLKSLAAEEHFQACKGAWVTHGMVRPHVTALRIVQDGRLLADELRPAVDLPEFGDSSPRTGPDPRREREPAHA